MRRRSEEESAAPAAGEQGIEKTKVTVDFPSAHRGKDLTGGFERIVEKVFVVNVEETYDRLEKDLRVGETRSDRASLTKALDNAETNARAAHKLLMTAKLEVERWESDNLPTLGAMREEATKVLQQEKAQGLRTKMITDADVDGTAATLFPEEWRAQHVKRERIRAMERSIDNLSTLWISRCRTLQAMVTALR